MSVFWLLLSLAVVSLTINFALGAWRQVFPKLSFWWFVTIHLSVPLIYLLRVQTGSPIWAIPILVGAAVAGQMLGGRLVPTLVQGPGLGVEEPGTGEMPPETGWQ